MKTVKLLFDFSNSKHCFNMLATNSFLKHQSGLIFVLITWLFLAITNLCNIPLFHHFRGATFSGGDFGQYYMGGVVANKCLWEHLYPVDLASSTSPDKSNITQFLAEELSKRNADVSWKYIYPPSLAVFLAPLDWMPFEISRMFFTILLFGSLVWFLILFRRECSDWNIPSKLSNLLVFFIGTGLPVCESIMMSNSTPFIALATLLALRSLRKNRMTGTVFSFALAGLFKGVSVVWIPILLLSRRWKIVLMGTLIGATVTVLPLLFGAKIDLWAIFFKDIIPGSRKLYWIGDGNLGLPSFFAWLGSDETYTPSFIRMLPSIQIALLVFIYAIYRYASNKYRILLEGLVLFLSTVIFQLFSPICWPHYAFNIVGFIPILLSMAGVKENRCLYGFQRISSVIVLISFIFVWFPIGNAMKYLFHVPLFGFGRTFGYLLMLAWGLVALVRISLQKGENNE